MSQEVHHSTLRFILQHAKPYYKYIAGSLVGVTLITFDAAFKPYLIKTLIDTVLGVLPYNIWLVCGLYAAFQMLIIGAWMLSDYCVTYYTAPLRLNIVKSFMEELYAYHYAFFQDQLAGNLNAKIGDNFQLIPTLITSVTHQFCYYVILITISYIFLAKTGWLFVGVTAGWMFCFLSITLLSLKKGIELTKNYAEEKSKVLGLSSDYLNNILAVKTFDAQKFEVKRFNNLKEDFIEIDYAQGFYAMRLYALQGIITTIYSMGFIVYLIISYQQKKITSGDFALVIMTSFNIITTMYQFSQALKQFIINWGSVDQGLSILQNAPYKKDTSDAQALRIDKAEIAFNNISFAYNNAEPIFTDLSVVIAGGQKVGLLGHSGDGKSTFANLILRLYRPQEGTITIDGQDIAQVTQKSLRAAIAIIPQNPPLFYRSVMDNIRYARSTASDQEVIQAALQAQAHDFIEKLPQGYATILAERGVKLSTGERQRIALARAFLKNPSILILDEATSQLDSETEHAIQESLTHLTKNKTTLIIAHRISSLRLVERILVFDQGTIVQDGTHEELFEQAGLYRSLWDAQIGNCASTRS